MTKKEQIIEQWASGQFKTQAELAKFLSVTTAYVSSVLAEGKPKAEKEDFDPQTYMQGNLEKIFKKLTATIAQKGSAKHIEMALKLMGLLVEKREDTHKFDFTPADYTRIAREFRDRLYDEYERNGVCSVCRRPKEELCTNSEKLELKEG
uniref:Uncharacterized protein n=1 Tax=viral metagenome TaxID=1070528 RepID=A0A6M3JVL3_9ZZZZ